MRMRAQRSLDELYGVTDRITEPEITPVLEGNCRIQGPVDESDHELCRMNSDMFPAGKNFLFKKSFPIRVESGTCNVCSAPCSSCMHNNCTMLAMESEMGCGSFQNSCVAKETDSCSFIRDDGMPRKSRMCDDFQCATSRSNGLPSPSSSHDSYSGNAESRETVKQPMDVQPSEDVHLPSFVPSRKMCKGQVLQGDKTVTDDCLFSSDSHITFDLCHRRSPEKGEEQKNLECHGDNISCITRIKDSNTKAHSHNADLDKKNAVDDPALTDVSPFTKVENEVDTEATYCSENEGRQTDCRRPISHSTKSFPRKCAVSGSAAFPEKSDLSGLLKDKSPRKVQSPCHPSQHGPSEDLSHGSSHQPCLGDEYLAVANTTGENRLQCKHKCSKANYSDRLKTFEHCLEIKKDSDKEILSDEAVKSTSKNEELQMSNSLAVESNMEASTLRECQPQLEQVIEDRNSESDAELTDVKVCDICGDAGREELLAICSTCTDGAEHTYCMRVMLRKVPEGNWSCEECQRKDDAKRRKVNKPEQVPETVEVLKHKDVAAAKKVDEFVKAPGTAKECKLTEFAEGKRVDKSGVVLGTSTECQLKENHQTKTVIKSEALPRTLKKTGLSESHLNIASGLSSKVIPKLDLKGVDVDMRRGYKGAESPKILAKRHVEGQDVTSTASRKPSQLSGECIDIDSPRKKPALSLESSFKNLDTGRTKSMNAPPNGGQSANISVGFSRSQSMLGSHQTKVHSQLQPPHGFLSRSSSFNSNSKPKVKQLTETLPVKPKISRESLLGDTRKGPLVKTMTKSASLKSMRYSLSTIDATSKTQFTHQCRVDDSRALKQTKEKYMIEKKNSAIGDRAPLISPRRVSSSIPSPRKEGRMLLHAVKSDNIPEPDFLGKRKGPDDATGLGRKEAKRQSITKNIVRGSANAEVNYEDHRPCQTPKEGAGGGSSSTDKLYNNSEMQRRGVLSVTDPTHQDDKGKDLGSGSKQAVSGGTGNLRCQRCMGTDHVTQFCSIDKLRSSSLKPYAEQSLKDEMKKGSKWKDAIKATISKSRLERNESQSDQSRELPPAFSVAGCEVASKDFLSSSSNHHRDILSVAGTSDRKEESLRSLDNDINTRTRVGDLTPQHLPRMQASCTSAVAQTIESACTEQTNIDKIDFASDAKHLSCIFPDQASGLSNPCRTSAIPELESIWQGSLEVASEGNEPAPVDGIQAHLSTSASPKVLNVAMNFPFRIQLEEVPWVSSWPLELHRIGPSEHNIALFFFAKDVDSYERSYSKLLERMLKNDLALRGFVCGFELLIFPSNKLPMHSQRWNRLFFLWGVFKGRRADSLTSIRISPKKPIVPILDNELAVQDLPCAPRSAVAEENHEMKSPRSHLLDKTKVAKSTICIETQAVSSPDSEHRMFKLPDSPVHQAVKSITCVETPAISSPEIEGRFSMLPDSPVHEDVKVETQAISPLKVEVRMFTVPESPVNDCLFQSIAHSSLPREQSNRNQLPNLVSARSESWSRPTNILSCSEVKNDDVELKIGGCDFGARQVITSAPAINEQIGLHKASPSCSTSECRIVTGTQSYRSKGLGKEVTSMENEAIFYNDPRRRLAEMDHFSWEENPSRKRARFCATKSVSPASGETSMDTGEKMLLNDRVTCLPAYSTTYDERDWKRLYCSEATSSVRSSCKVYPISASQLNEWQSVSGGGDSHGGPISDNSGRQAEKFFPVEPNPGQHKQPEDLIHILSSDDEDDPESDVLNLELALGGKQKTKRKQLMAEPAEDADVSASLSLSLAVPTPKEEWPRPSLKLEQHLQDRTDVNTTLFLFGGFTDT